MKSFKEFLQEIYQEEETSTFTHNGKEYHLNGVFRDTQKTPIEKIPVSKLKWIMKYSPMGKSDQKRIQSADLSTPILYTKEGNTHIILDGAHRLAKALDTNISHLPGKFVSKDILKKNIKH